jgi:hypothetical protein
MEILQLPALTLLLSGEYTATELLSTIFLTIVPSLLSFPCRARLKCQPSAELSLTNQLLHFSSFHSIVTVLCASHFRGKVFAEPLPSNAYSFSLSLHSNATTRYNMVVFWIMTPCSLAIRKTYSLHIKSRRCRHYGTQPPDYKFCWPRRPQ